MNNFLEIETIYDKIVLINVQSIVSIQQGIDLDFNLIWLTNGEYIKTHETIEEIKAKL
jgi:hypothetical protein